MSFECIADPEDEVVPVSDVRLCKFFMRHETFRMKSQQKSLNDCCLHTVHSFKMEAASSETTILAKKRSFHCMRCHKSFDPRSNHSLACVMMKPYPFHGPHTIDAKTVDYTKFDICDSESCGMVLHSFTFHLKLIQEEKECMNIEQELNKKDQLYQQELEDQLELLQILKQTRAGMALQQKQKLNAKWERTIDYQYYNVMSKLINKHQEDIKLEHWTKKMMEEEDKLLKTKKSMGTQQVKTSSSTKRGKLRSPIKQFQKIDKQKEPSV
jgi:hypothetical protein